MLWSLLLPGSWRVISEIPAGADAFELGELNEGCGESSPRDGASLVGDEDELLWRNTVVGGDRGLESSG